MGVKKVSLDTAIVEFYREEIRQRYQLERLRQIPEFETVHDSMLDALREFFLDRLYPPASVRDEMDEAFDDLSHLLRSPSRLTPLIGAAIGTMLRLSFHLTAIVSTGIATVDAIRETRHLETSLMKVAKSMHSELDEALENRKSTLKYRHAMLRLIHGVPEKTVRSLIDDVLRLFSALSDVKMLTGMLHLVERCMGVMETRRDLYTDKDRQSLKLCLEVLRGGHSLFMQLKPKDFPKIIKGIERVETSWYDSIEAQIEEIEIRLNRPETHG